MKIKLLKKIRKRFSYYKNKKGIMVIVDHYEQKAYTCDKELLKTEYPKFPVDEIDDDVLFRLFKVIITEPFINGFNQKMAYRYATRRSKRK